jgi:hypothetical protein
MTSPNPDVRRAQSSGYFKDALDALEHAQTQYLHTELQAEGDEMRRVIDQLKVLRGKLSGPRK